MLEMLEERTRRGEPCSSSIGSRCCVWEALGLVIVLKQTVMRSDTIDDADESMCAQNHLVQAAGRATQHGMPRQGAQPTGSRS